MDEMRELYEKVAKSSMLQKKLVWIANEAPTAGRKKTRERMIDLAKEAGFDVTIEEMRSFFSNLSAKQQVELSDAELEGVAGGVDTQNIFMRLISIYT